MSLHIPKCLSLPTHLWLYQADGLSFTLSSFYCIYDNNNFTTVFTTRRERKKKKEWFARFNYSFVLLIINIWRLNSLADDHHTKRIPWWAVGSSGSRNESSDFSFFRESHQTRSRPPNAAKWSNRMIVAKTVQPARQREISFIRRHEQHLLLFLLF